MENQEEIVLGTFSDEELNSQTDEYDNFEEESSEPQNKEEQ
ncbi:hypothetical protein OFO07_03505 [Campylobacter sp. JMF_06 NA1]|nr:hypothetical protein [Campylobacter sp. JMF_06 NA1]MDA3077991.1 hypothetical protein [Campylobacter sp. JMF_06 NA1]